MKTGSALEQAVEVFAAIHFLIIGLSHLLRPREWARFFADLRGRGTTGALLNGMLSLGMGSVIAAFHNVWTWPGVVLTVIGWLYLGKSLVIFTMPDVGVRSMESASESRFGRVRVARGATSGPGNFSRDHCGCRAVKERESWPAPLEPAERV